MPKQVTVDRQISNEWIGYKMDGDLYFKWKDHAKQYYGKSKAEFIIPDSCTISLDRLRRILRRIWHYAEIEVRLQRRNDMLENEV